MPEIILALIIFALLGYIVYLNEKHRDETQLLLNRLMAKDLNEFREYTVPLKPEKAAKVPSQYADMNAIPDEEWDTIIKQQAGTESTTAKAVRTLKSKVLRK